MYVRCSITGDIQLINMIETKEERGTSLEREYQRTFSLSWSVYRLCLDWVVFYRSAPRHHAMVLNVCPVFDHWWHSIEQQRWNRGIRAHCPGVINVIMVWWLSSSLGSTSLMVLQPGWFHHCLWNTEQTIETEDSTETSVVLLGLWTTSENFAKIELNSVGSTMCLEKGNIDVVKERILFKYLLAITPLSTSWRPHPPVCTTGWLCPWRRMWKWVSDRAAGLAWQVCDRLTCGLRCK